jgi:voltage-gated potassium channel
VATILMILGYAMIAVPAGIVPVELAPVQRPSGTQACRGCGAEGHDPDTEFCRYCGGRL